MWHPPSTKNELRCVKSAKVPFLLLSCKVRTGSLNCGRVPCLCLCSPVNYYLDYFRSLCSIDNQTRQSTWSYYFCQTGAHHHGYTTYSSQKTERTVAQLGPNSAGRGSSQIRHLPSQDHSLHPQSNSEELGSRIYVIMPGSKRGCSFHMHFAEVHALPPPHLPHTLFMYTCIQVPSLWPPHNAELLNRDATRKGSTRVQSCLLT